MSSSPIALVTGGSRGIGKAVAMELCAMGYKVQLVARSQSTLEAAQRDIFLQSGEEPNIYALDVCDVHAVHTTVQDIAARYGRIDVLFNGAGVSLPGTLNLEAETLTKLFNVNLRAPFTFMQEIVPLMEKQGYGHIINVASRNGKVAVAGLGCYSATKYGLVGLSESVYRQVADKGISVTTLCPGWVNTDMAAHEGPSLAPEEMIQPEDVAATVRWLLSLRRPVRVMEVLMECAKDVERRASVELAKLYALRERHREEYETMTL